MIIGILEIHQIAVIRMLFKDVHCTQHFNSNINMLGMESFNCHFDTIL